MDRNGRDLSQQDLVERARRGDRYAQEALFLTFKDRVFAVAYRVLGDWHEAEEVTLDTFHAAFSGLEAFAERSGFGTWCYRIVTNRSIDRVRKRKRRAPFHAYDTDLSARPSEAPSPDQGLLRREVSSCIEQALGTLPVETRATLVLKEVSGLTYREIADAMDCSMGTVASRIARGRERLAAYLQAAGIDRHYLEAS